MAFCTHCGAQLRPEELFCTGCGRNIKVPESKTILPPKSVQHSKEKSKVGKWLLSSLLGLALLGVISAVAIPALLKQRSKLKQASHAGLLPDGVGDAADKKFMDMSSGTGFEINLNDYITKYNAALLAHTNQFLKTSNNEEAQRPVLNLIDSDESITIMATNQKDGVAIANSLGVSKNPAWRNQAYNYSWFWTDSQNNIKMIKCAARSFEKSLRAFGIELHDYYDSAAVISAMEAARGNLPGPNRLKFVSLNKQIVGEYFIIDKISKQDVYVRMVSVPIQSQVPNAIEPNVKARAESSSTPGSEAWFLRERYEAQGKFILGVSIEKIDQSWADAEILSLEKLCQEGRAEMPNRPEYSFQADYDIDRDGINEKLAVGIYKDRAGHSGRFLVALKPSSNGALMPFGVVKADEPRFTAIVKGKDGEPVWAFGIDSSDAATIAWNKGVLEAKYWGSEESDEGAMEQTKPVQSNPSKANGAGAKAASDPSPQVTGISGSARITKLAPATYPQRAIQLKWGLKESHFVKVKVFVGAQGLPLKVVVVEGVPGSFGFEEAALEAANKSTFAPAVQGGKPVNGWTEPITIEFPKR